MHPDQEQLERLAHGELARPAEMILGQHLEACADCRARLATLRHEEVRVHALLRLLDHPAPAVTASVVLAQAGIRSRGWGRLAAGLLLALGVSGVAYALPGSPLPRWLDAVVEQVTGRREPSGESARETPPAPVTPEAGVAVTPGASLVIQFLSPEEASVVEVSLTEGTEVVVRAPAGVAGFTSVAGRLVIANRGTARFAVAIPVSAARVEIQVGGRRIFLKEESRLVTAGGAEPSGLYRLPLVPPPN